MAVIVTSSMYNQIIAQRDTALSDVAQFTLQRDQAELQRISRQQDVNDYNAIIADLTTNANQQ